jgi:gliding motility-associated-like protein
VSNSGYSAIDSVRITVNLLPTADAGADDTICKGDSISLIASGSVGNAFLWSTGSTTATVVVSPTVITTYTLTVTNSNNCTDTDEIIVTVDSAIANAGADTMLCKGESAIITASGGGTYLWNTGYTNETITVTPTIATTYTVTVTNTHGCTATDEIIITIGIQPVANFIGEPTLIVQNKSVQFTDLSDDAIAWHWSFGANQGESTLQNPLNTYRDTGFFTVELIVISSDECTDTLVRTDYIEVGKRQDIFIPKAFTPNNDGKNDILFVRGLQISNLQFTIYNQWGLKVFESTNQATGWDGTWQGKEQPEGNYAYVFTGTTIEGKEVHQEEVVTLLR